MRVLSCLLFILECGRLVFAGQSLQVSGNTFASAALTGRAHDVPSRVEFYVHDWDVNQTGNSFITRSDSVGIVAVFVNVGTGVNLQISNNFESGPFTNNGLCLVPIN